MSSVAGRTSVKCHIRAEQGEVGHQWANRRGRGNVGKSDQLLHCQADILLRGQAGQDVSEAKVACGCEPCVRRVDTREFVIGRNRGPLVELGMRCQEFGDELLERDAVEASNFDGQNRA